MLRKMDRPAGHSIGMETAAKYLQSWSFLPLAIRNINDSFSGSLNDQGLVILKPKRNCLNSPMYAMIG